jgi:hypothetical protein
VLFDAETILRIAGAIGLETLALCVWNVGTRSLQATLADMTRALRSPRSLVSGTFSVLVGLVFVAAATVLLVPAVGDLDGDFVPLMIYTFVAALVLEFLIGNDLRAALRRIVGARSAR